MADEQARNPNAPHPAIDEASIAAPRHGARQGS